MDIIGPSHSRPPVQGLIFLVFAALAVECSIYFLFVYNTSIPTDSGDVVSASLLQNRELGAAVGVITSFVLVYFGLPHIKKVPRRWIVQGLALTVILCMGFHEFDHLGSPNDETMSWAITGRLRRLINAYADYDYDAPYKSYTITHFRCFHGLSKTWYVYDFSALCDVNSEEKSFSSRVALTKEDGSWTAYTGVQPDDFEH